MPDEYKADGWVNFSGGMRASDGARSSVGEDQAEYLVNVTVRRGRAEPRPAWKAVDISWIHREAQSAFERGVIQGSAYYDSPSGPRFVYVADGYILSFDPVSNLMRRVSPGKLPCFHRLARFAWLQQRGRWMVCQDGINPPVILDGDNATVNDDPYNGVPTGMSMADGWNRMVIAAADRKRLFISDHEYDPISDPLKFTEDSAYYKNAKFFEVPRSLGRIVGVKFAPSFNNQDDWGPLLVFGERGTRAFQMQIPRENWIDQDIAATLLPTIGACAHGAMVARGNDLVFSDQFGRIQTFKQAITRRDDVRLQPADQAVYPLYRGEFAEYRRYRKSARFDDRIITTVWPEPIQLANGRTAVRHRGMVVMEEDHISNRPFVWAGLWTGIYPVSIDSGGVAPNEHSAPVDRCFAVSHDPDGIQRLYELTREPGPDLMPEPRRVPMWIVPRWQDYKVPLRLKSVNAAALQLENLRGRVTIQGWWQSAGRQPAEWFTHHDAGADCLLFGVGGNCGISEPVIEGRPRFNLPTPPDAAKFYRSRPWLRITGNVAIEEGIFESAITSGQPQSDVKCTPPASAIGRAKLCEPNFWEPHSRDLPIEPPLPVTPCNV